MARSKSEEKRLRMIKEGQEAEAREDVKEEVQQEQEFSFPEHRLTIKAANLEEAKEKLNEELKKHKTL